MAAKRPHLFPLWDSRIDDVIELPVGQLWEPMRTLVRGPEARRRRLSTRRRPMGHGGRCCDGSILRFGYTATVILAETSQAEAVAR